MFQFDSIENQNYVGTVASVRTTGSVVKQIETNATDTGIL
jgi:hypothetical protein